jgi:predicted nucleotidyltransferase
MSTENSDIDVRGVFVPARDSLLFGNPPEEINFSSGQANEKNSKDDVDIKLFSVQKFIKLCSKGDTNGLDLLYSITNKECIIYYDKDAPYLFNNPDKLIDIKNAVAYVGYAIGQAKKYGIKGSRMGVLKNICEWLPNTTMNLNDDAKLVSIIAPLIYKFQDDSYCFVKEQKGVDYLCICGAMHQLSITIKEFSARINKDYETFGERAREAEKNNGVDWKALSHALRVLYQCKELYKTGAITFPLGTASYLLDVKQGKYEYDFIANEIINNLDLVKEMRESCTLNFKYDHKWWLEYMYCLYY